MMIGYLMRPVSKTHVSFDVYSKTIVILKYKFLLLLLQLTIVMLSMQNILVSKRSLVV